jgi:hypothetical protein
LLAKEAGLILQTSGEISGAGSSPQVAQSDWSTLVRMDAGFPPEAVELDRSTQAANGLFSSPWGTFYRQIPDGHIDEVG